MKTAQAGRYYQVWANDDGHGSYSVETTPDLFARSYSSLEKARQVRARFLRNYRVDPANVIISEYDGAPWRSCRYVGRVSE
jgi:hypothetical protein